MSDTIKRPENFNLDDEQNKSLFAFLSQLKPSQLKAELKKLEETSEIDDRFGGGGLPANVNKIRNFITSLLEE